jgi:8-oxo-dGTP pyrophosphatase MutT (NUDIX family)
MRLSISESGFEYPQGHQIKSLNKGDSERINMPRLYASVALIRNPSDPNLFLGISRKHDHTDFGLIGGKIESGETPDKAVVREVKEETNLVIDNLVIIYAKILEDSERIVICYECTTKSYDFESPQDEGVVKWVTREELEAGSYASYNKSLFEVLDKRIKV